MPNQADVVERLREQSSVNSHVVERFMEHVFLAQVLEELWIRRGVPVAVAHSEVDATGFDLTLQAYYEADDRVSVRHVQLKASLGSGNPVKLNPKLWNHKGGCLVWLKYKVTDECRLDVTYSWLNCRKSHVGGEELNYRNEPLEHVLVGKHGATDRVKVRRSDCQTVTIEELARRLFP